MKYLKQTDGTYIAYFTNGMITIRPGLKGGWNLRVGYNDVLVSAWNNAPSLEMAVYNANKIAHQYID